MTVVVDSAPWFGGTSHSLSIEGMHGNAVNKTSLPLSRATRRLDAFPPPLQSSTVCDALFSHLDQVDRVSFTCVRSCGRLILIEKLQPPSLPRRSIRSQRHNGRLQLRLYVSNTEQNPLQEEKPVAQVPLENHQHSSLERNLGCTVQGQRGNLAIHLMNEMSFARYTALQLPVHPSPHKDSPTRRATSRHVQSIVMHASTAMRPDERMWIVMHELPERINPAPVPSHHSSSAERLSSDLHSNRLATDSLPVLSKRRIPAQGFAENPIQHTLYATAIGKKEKPKPGNAWAQEQRELVARIAFEIERGQQKSMGEKISLPDDFHDSPDAEMKKGDDAKERNPNADTEIPKAGSDRKGEARVEKGRKGESSTAENGAKERRGREKGRRQENRTPKPWNRRENGKGRRDEKDTATQLRRLLMEGEAVDLTTEHFLSGSLAFLRTSLRPLSMLNL